MPKIRVLVVEDSLTVREHLLEVLRSDPDLEVVGQASNGQLGIELCRELRPDVVTLDMHLPVMDGVTATEHIMAHFPTPILIVSASTNRGDLFKTYDALAAGAVDVLEKNTGREPDGVWEARFLAAVKLVSRIRVITHPRARLGLSKRSDPPNPSLPPRSFAVAGDGKYRVIALGASTGGPGALVKVISGIPRHLPLSILVVLHIDDPFATAFAEWLSKQTHHPVRYARGGEPLFVDGSRVLMAPPGKHLIASKRQLMLSSGPERHSCRPSVDELFESLALESGPQTIASLLTGMGRDGAAGLLALRKAGAHTIAQDEASSVVWGMPREAVLIGAADRVLPLSEIAGAIGVAAGKANAFP
jgi:two-component system, chemotaxis family, protein-glutamate methylesterase/glutaminase